MNGKSSFSIDDSMMLVADNFNESELLLSPTDIPNEMPDNLTCAIDTMEELLESILIQVIKHFYLTSGII